MTARTLMCASSSLGAALVRVIDMSLTPDHILPSTFIYGAGACSAVLFGF